MVHFYSATLVRIYSALDSGAKNFKPQEEWIADGAFGFVSKPINFEELYPLVIQALESKTTEHESRQQLQKRSDS